MKCLIIDNHDSFTFNIVHLIGRFEPDIMVVRNDCSIDAIDNINADRIIISPGPGKPAESGVCRNVIQKYHSHKSILGICLGHQIIAEFFGARVDKAPKPAHGTTSPIFHQGRGVFMGMPAPFNAARYHSLCVISRTMPECLGITAQTKDGTIMGLKHQDYNVHGIQFHPESFLTEHGEKIIENFLYR